MCKNQCEPTQDILGLNNKQPRRAIINLISTRRVRNLLPALIELGLSAVYNVVLSLYFCLLSAISVIPIRLIEDTI